MGTFALFLIIMTSIQEFFMCILQLACELQTNLGAAVGRVLQREAYYATAIYQPFEVYILVPPLRINGHGARRTRAHTRTDTKDT